MACVRKRRGKWVVDFRDHEGRRRWETYNTRKEADDALSKRVGQLNRGSYRSPAQIPPFGDVAKAWLAERREESRHSSYSVWESQVTLHLLPAFEQVKVNAITPAMVRTFRSQKSEIGLSRTMVNKLAQTLGSILDMAVADEVIERNPVLRVRRQKNRNSEKRTADEKAIREDEVLTNEEVGKLLAEAEPGLFRAFLMTAALTGCRSGELLALRWDEDVDLEARTLTVRRSLTWTKSLEQRGGPPVPEFTPPKSEASRRTIELAPQLATELKRWRLACPNGVEALVFPKLDGGPQHRSYVTLRGFKPALERAGLRSVKLHSLRHSFASTLIMRGAPVTQVAHLLGHKKPSVTLDVYARWFRRLESADALRDVADCMVGRRDH